MKISEDTEAITLSGAFAAGVQSGVNVKIPLGLVVELTIAPSRAGMEATSFTANVSFVQTAGYAAPGDGGSALYMRVDAEPSHEGKVQSLDGAWWEIVVEGGQVKIEQFGGKADWNGTTGTDNTQPLLRALSLALRSSSALNDNTKIAPRVLFRTGNYYFGDTFELRTCVHILGTSTGMWNRNGGTNWFVPADKTGIITQQINTTGATGKLTVAEGTSSGSIFQGITFRGAGTDKTKHGFQMRTRTALRQCYFYGFPGDGIHIEATAGSETIEGNCNGWIVDDCQAEDFGRHGLFVKGNDVNTGRCNFETKGIAGPYGCGIYDSSGLGNIYERVQITGYGNHGVHHNGMRYYLIDGTPGIGAATEPGTNNNVWWEFQQGDALADRFEDWSAEGDYMVAIPIYHDGGPSLFLDPYVEGSAPIRTSSSGLVVGGQNNPTGRSPSLKPIGSGTLIPVMSRTGVGGRREFVPGTAGHAANGTFVWVAVGTGVSNDEDGMNLLEHRRQIDGDASWSWQYSGGSTIYGFQNAKPVWTIGTPTTTQKMGRALTPVPHTLSLHDYALRDPGDANVWRVHGIRAAIPTAAGEYARGEFRWNSAPSAGGTLGWVCTTGGALAPAWVTGTNYALGAYVKASNTKFYKCTVDGGVSSTVEPSHASGAVTEADGFQWTYVTDTEAVWKPVDGIGA